MLVDYWRAIHPAAGLPGRQHFDPVDIPHLLANIRMLDVVGQPPRFRIRLAGTGVVKTVGEDQTSQWLDEAFPGFERSSAALGLNDVVRTGRLNWRRGNPRLLEGKEYMVIERVYLPFARDGQTVDLILSYVLLGDSRGLMF
jgi:PAS domain